MDEQTTHEATWRPPERARRMQEHAVENANEAVRMASQLGEVGAQTVGLWTEVNQKVVRDLLDVQADAVREAARMAMGWQEAQLEAVREMQASAWRLWLAWPHLYSDPLRWYQRSTEETVGGLQRVVRLGRRGVDGVNETVDRLQGSAEQAARSLDGLFRDAASRMRDIQARSERLRVA
jgi:hypothetical protein